MDVRRQQGFVLVQVLMAAAIVCIIALMTATIVSNISDAGARAKFENDMVNDIQLLRTFLQDIPTCTENLKGHTYVEEQPSPTFNLTKVVSNGSGVPVRGTTPLIDSDILSSVRFVRSTENTGRFELAFSHPSNRKVLPRSRTIAVTAEFDASNRILRCGTGDIGLASGIKPGQVRNISGGCSGDPPGAGILYTAEIRRRVESWKQLCTTLTYPAPAKPYAFGARDDARAIVPIEEREYRELNPEVDEVRGSSFRGPYANLFQCENDGVIPQGTIHSEVTETGAGDDSGARQFHICSDGVWKTTGHSR